MLQRWTMTAESGKIAVGTLFQLSAFRFHRFPP